jgi:antitoxin (DNA-binding transcriptional repressor) of toxin-antitoxin stability system
VLITRNGKPVALLLAVHGKVEAERLASRSRSLRSIFEGAHEQIKKGEAIPQDQFWREVERRRRGKRPGPGRNER